jgi:hypothetical protein
MRQPARTSTIFTAKQPPNGSAPHEEVDVDVRSGSAGFARVRVCGLRTIPTPRTRRLA